MNNSKIPMTDAGERIRVRKSLKLSILDGSAFAAMMGLTQNYITPFALALKATTAHIGLLTSFPNLMTAMSQLAAPKLTERAESRKGFMLPMVFVHALMWLPVMLIPFVFPSSRVWWLIAFVTVGSIFGSIANPAWGSMMADLVPVRLRGRYFGSRTRIAGIVFLAFSFLAGGILELLNSHVFAGFAILFGGAALCRFLSFYFLARMYEPPTSGNKEAGQSLVQTLRHLGITNLGRFTLYIALINFTTYIASPFFAVYMLSDLKFSYTDYIINLSFNAIAGLAFQTYWGRRADWAGNIKVITITSFLIPLVPVVWLVSFNRVYLIGAQIFSGFAWAGFTLTSTNFVYDASETENRTQHIAIFNALSGIGICLGALVGGFLVPYLPLIKGYQLLTLFLVSGLLRALVVVFLLRLIFEVRRVPKVRTVEFLLGHSITGASGTDSERVVSRKQTKSSSHLFRNNDHRDKPKR